VQPNRLHVQVQGRGAPTVVLEAGIAASSVSWSLVQPRIGELTTVVSYDRAGFGWSDPPRAPCTAARAADDLRGMLEAAGLSGPYILVGHSFGGLIARRFQQQSPAQVAGMVLVDPVVRAEWREASEAKRRMLGRGVMLSRRGALLARMGVVGLALKLLTSGSQRVPKLLARVSAGSGAGVTDRLVGEVRKMPRELWPAIAQHWSQAQSFQAMADYLENLPRSAAELDEQRTLGDLPLVVLSASKRIPEHARDAALSTRGRHIVVPGSGHWIQLDAPDAVVDAVGQLVAEVRTL
jgi:pimeloyl-ACP methyl ester carboxylesterase